jgi:hypothetical protein
MSRVKAGNSYTPAEGFNERFAAFVQTIKTRVDHNVRQSLTLATAERTPAQERDSNQQQTSFQQPRPQLSRSR